MRSPNILKLLIAEILSEATRKPRPPGYDDAIKDTSRSHKDVAYEFGLNPETIRRERQVLSLKMPPVNAMTRTARWSEYEEALKNPSISTKDVAYDFGLSPSVVRKDRHDISSALPAGRPRLARPPGYEEALQDVTRTHQEVADAFGFNIMTVFRDRQAAGVKMKMGGSKPRAMPDTAQSNTPEFKPTVDPDEDPSLSVRDFPPIKLPIMTEPARYDDDIDYEDEPEDVDILSLFGRRR